MCALACWSVLSFVVVRLLRDGIEAAVGILYQPGWMGDGGQVWEGLLFLFGFRQMGWLRVDGITVGHTRRDRMAIQNILGLVVKVSEESKDELRCGLALD